MSSEGRFNYYSRIWLNISERSLSRISYHMLLTQLNSATDSYRWLAKINGCNTLEFEFLKDHVQEPNINYEGNRGMDLLRCLHNLCTHAFDSVGVNNKRVYVYLDAFPWIRISKCYIHWPGNYSLLPQIHWACACNSDEIEDSALRWRPLTFLVIIQFLSPKLSRVLFKSSVPTRVTQYKRTTCSATTYKLSKPTYK